MSNPCDVCIHRHRRVCATCDEHNGFEVYNETIKSKIARMKAAKGAKS